MAVSIEHGGPPPRDHPLWPAFQHWAKDNLQNRMLAAYWEVWQAAYKAGHAAARAESHPPLDFNMEGTTRVI